MNTDTEYSVELFNGHLTVTNPTTGGVQIYRIRTEKWGPKRNKRKVRVVAKKVGRDFESFAIVNGEGEVKPFRKFDDKTHRAHASIVANPEGWISKHGFGYQVECTCRECGRELTDPDSIRSGIGPVCIKHLGLHQQKLLFKSMDDGELFGEFRSALADRDWELARLAWGWMTSPDYRESAKLAFRKARESNRQQAA